VLELTAVVPGRLDAALTVTAGETVAVLGPNGAGKSTLLAAIAGLLRPASGSVTLAGRTLFDADTWEPPHRRGVSLLAQDALLFPHLSVLENVAFGPRSAGHSAAESRETAMRWLAEVGAQEFARRRPGRLSGGQAQRVAVARALASDPRLLLLDEPMAALDVTVVPAMRGVLKRVLADRTVIIVTHDVIDAYTLADRVVVLEAGRIVDAGPTREVLARPRTPFAAALVGLNLLVGESTAEGLLVEGRSVVASVPLLQGVSAAATVPPALVTIGPGANEVEGVVESVETRGDVVRVHVGGLAADVAPDRLDLFPGDRATLSFPPSAVTLYPL
jgi:molybdate transport system ATP-binding protein